MSALPGREKESPSVKKMVGCQKSFLSCHHLYSFLRNVSAGPTLRVIRDRTKSRLFLPLVARCHVLSQKKLKSMGEYGQRTPRIMGSATVPEVVLLQPLSDSGGNHLD